MLAFVIFAKSLSHNVTFDATSNVSFKVTLINLGSYPMNELECRPLTAWGPESMTDARKIFAANLARLVVRQGFSKSGLAGALKVKTQMVSRWLKGETLPSKYLEAIAEYLQVPISSLFSEPTSEVSPVRLKKITPEDAVRVIAGEFGLTVRKIKKTDD